MSVLAGRRRWLAALGSGIGVAGARAHGTHARPREPWVAALIEDAERHLAAGDAETALQRFERTAEAEHSASVEIGIVRSRMQLGQYRQALAFVAHVAGVHADEAIGSALYVWLLSVGGQTAFARSMLERARRRLPGDPLLADAAAALALPLQAMPAAWRAPPMRFVPASTPALGTILSTALRLDARTAIAPAAAVATTSGLRVSDARGRSWPAKLERVVEPLRLAVLEMSDTGADSSAPVIEWPARDPWPGAPASAVEYAFDTGPAWPWLRTGFIGAARGRTRRLDMALDGGLRGGPVFDARGECVGVTSDGANGVLLLTPSLLREASLIGPPTASAPQRPGSPPPDAVYELAMPLTLQVWGTRL